MSLLDNAQFDPRRRGALGRKQLWPWIPSRKLMSGAYAVDWPQLQPYYEEGWTPYFLPIPSTQPPAVNSAAMLPPILVGPQDTLEFQAVSPVSFVALAVLVYTLQAAGATVQIYLDSKDYPLINPGGPPLNIQNLGGSGRRQHFLKRLLKIPAGASLLADVANAALTGNFAGQIAIFGFQPPGGSF